jgi:pyridoxal phosphate enzyme (YggS family)
MTERKPQTESSTTIPENLRAVREEIASAAEAVDREPGAVTLVAVSKLQDEDKIRQTLKAGHRTFGENRVQEAKVKWPQFKNSYPDIVLHLIGPLQTNKARDAVKLFDAIESLDRLRLGRALAEAMEKSGCRPDCFIQVNTGEEPQKTGVLPAEADALIAACRDDLGLPVVGLMCIPPHNEEPSLHFALLDEIARRNELAGLSMGMSGDYPIAVRFGATHVRVGTGVFGPRLVPRGA